MSLSDTLQQIKEGAKERVPKESLELMAKATKELRESGILERAWTTGASLPAFELLNTENKKVSSVDLLKKGPLVLTFYRGDW